MVGENMLKELPGFPGQYATEDGLIYSDRSGELRLKPQRLDTKGYLRVNLRDDSVPAKDKQLNVHTCVLLAFVGPKPEGMECRHLNGNCHDNRLENLKWGTHQENMQDQIRHGTLAALRHGENHIKSKLNNKSINTIRWLRDDGCSQKEIATMFSITQRHVSDILRYETWKKDIGVGPLYLQDFLS